MKERFLKFEKMEELGRDIADNALIGIGNAWEIVKDMGNFVDADFSYQSIAEHLKKHSYYFGKALFGVARNSTGAERLKYVEGFKKMLAIIGGEDREKLLKDLMTNIETVKGLKAQAIYEIGVERKERRRQKIKSIISVFKKKVDDKK